MILLSIMLAAAVPDSLESQISACLAAQSTDACKIRSGETTLTLSPGYTGFIWTLSYGHDPIVWSFECPWDIIRQRGGCALEAGDDVGLVMQAGASNPGLYWSAKPVPGSLRRITFAGSSPSSWNGTEEINPGSLTRILSLMEEESAVTFYSRQSPRDRPRVTEIDLHDFSEAEAMFVAVNHVFTAEHRR